jgi:hypothetical protein
MPKHVGVEKKLERFNKKIQYFREHLLVFLQTILNFVFLLMRPKT